MNRSFFLKFLVFLNSLAVIGLLASYAAGFFSPEQAWILAFFGLAYPVLLIINVLFVLLWLVLWKKYIFISLISVLVGWSSLRTVFPVHLFQPDPPAGQPLKVTSFNVHHFYGNQQTESIPENRSKVAGFLTGQESDIVCIQEFFAIGEDFSQTLDKFAKSIQMEYNASKNYKAFFNKQKIVAIATFSRYPVAATGHFTMQDGLVYAIYSDIVINMDTIRVYNLHLESIRFGNDDYSFYTQLTDPDKDATPIKEGSKRMISKMRKAFILRSAQVHTLTRHIEVSPYPVILTGDFNDTPSSYTYHQLTTGLTDAYKEAGEKFMEGTYAGKLPSFRIDYILHSKEFSTLNYKKFDVDLSDHFPIAATLVFNH